MSLIVGIVEMDQKSTHLHPFGGPGSWDRYKEVGVHSITPYALAHA